MIFLGIFFRKDIFGSKNSLFKKRMLPFERILAPKNIGTQYN
jgi:hypothetical protein